jgi:putative NADH-flavin reductase
MSRVVVFGAGGRAGRRIVAEARSRGHEVVAIVRRPSAHPDIDSVEGDVTDADDVRRLSADADVVVNAVARMDIPATEFYAAATRALVDGMDEGRLLTIGIGTMLEAVPGVRLMDAPDFPADAKAFSEGHVSELSLLEASPESLDWVVLTPPPVLIDELAETSAPLQVRVGPALLSSTDTEFSYADLAAATLDEIEASRHHRTQVAVARL